MKNGGDGTTATGTMYFSGAKMRAELKSDGQDIVVLADPAAKSQYVLMPSEKMFMQMPIGEGPMSLPVTGASDPANPCSGGSGNTDCEKGDNASVNGYQTVQWDYTSKDGTRTHAWVATKLRFPIKTQDDNGSSMEMTNIAEGPQAAGLFSIPPGYTKMDVGMMGGVGGSRGRGRGSASDPMAAMMANLPPEAQAAMAAGMRGGEGARGAPAVTGSGWEKGNGWLLTFTIKGTDTHSGKGKMLDVESEGRSSFSVTYEGSIPLNHGAPSAGVAGMPGPMWSLLAGAPGLGAAAAERLPISGSVVTGLEADQSWKGDCTIIDPGRTKTTMRGTGKNSASITKIQTEMIGQAMFKLSGDLKTYDLLMGISGPVVKEISQIHEETGMGCNGRAVSAKDKTETKDVGYGFTVDMKGLPLPSTMGPVTGSKKVKVRFGDREGEIESTVSWTITPIR